VLSTYTGSAHLDGPSAKYKPTLVLNEQHLYGSKRLGVRKANITIFEDEVTNPPANTYWEATGTPNAAYNTPTANVGLLARGKVRYEISDHLGNVRSVITDRRLEYDLDANTIPDNFTADVVSAQDYYPFGMNMPGRQYANAAFANDYRYGFNGMERDDELNGVGNSYTAEYWQYDSRLGRRWNMDPMFSSASGWSPYRAYYDNPIRYVDPIGLLESTDVELNDDGTYTVVNAHDDDDNNIYVVNEDGERTGETIGTTLTPIDFMNSNDKTGELNFSKSLSGVTFDLNNLTVSGTVQTNERVSNTIYNADAYKLLSWGQELFQDELTRRGGATAYGDLELLGEMSANDGPLDFKESLGLPKYTAIKAGNTSDGKPIITNLRVMGNITFGVNMRATKPPLGGTEEWYYKKVMQKVGAYNQSQNNGNGYNKGFPYFGETTFSGSFIYFGYFGEFYD
jgi:RHS repeat-associated protein